MPATLNTNELKKSMRRTTLSLALLAALLMGCERADSPAPKTTSASANACLDQICPGDELPKYDYLKEQILKINGQWYVGPREYFGGGNRAGFDWWEHKPVPGGTRPPGLQAEAVAGKGYDYSIEMFFRSYASIGISKPGRPHIERLRQAEAEGRLISKTTPRPGLEVWRIREPGITKKYVWYVATDLKRPDGALPVVACAELNSAFDTCTTGFTWLPEVSVDLRFHARHGPDWPEIHQEINRVLQLLRKV